VTCVTVALGFLARLAVVEQMKTLADVVGKSIFRTHCLVIQEIA
jgi:hypothetical protein